MIKKKEQSSVKLLHCIIYMSTKGDFVTMSITMLRLHQALLLHRNKNVPNCFKKFYNSRVK